MEYAYIQMYMHIMFWSIYLPKKIPRRTEVKHQATAVVFQSWMHIHITRGVLNITKAWAPSILES